MAENDEKLAKVIFELPEPGMGVSGERLWAAQVGPDLYELRNSPWHARNVNWFDIVEAHPEADDQWPKFTRVHKRGGHKTIHVYILKAGQPRRQEILDECNRLGATYENADGKLYALDFAPGIEVKETIEYLQSLEAQELLGWRINDYD